MPRLQVVVHDGEVKVVSSGFITAAEAEKWVRTNRPRFAGRTLKIEVEGQPRLEAAPTPPVKMKEFERAPPKVPTSEQVPLGARGEFERAKVIALDEKRKAMVKTLDERQLEGKVMIFSVVDWLGGKLLLTFPIGAPVPDIVKQRCNRLAGGDRDWVCDDKAIVDELTRMGWVALVKSQAAKVDLGVELRANILAPIEDLASKENDD